MKKLVYILILFCFHFSYSQNFNSFNRDPNFNNFTLPIGHNFINENVIKSEVIDNQKNLVLTNSKIVKISSNNIIDDSFNTGTGFKYITTLSRSLELNDFAVQPDGKILVMGEFNRFNNLNVHSLIRLNTDGSLDNTFNFLPSYSTAKVTSNEFNKILIQDDGKIIIIGDIGNGNLRNITRLNPDGTRDTTFNIANGYYGTICLAPNNKYYVSFQLTIGSNYNMKSLARINSNGTFDSSFPVVDFLPVNDYLTTINKILIDDNHIYVGGNFARLVSSTSAFNRRCLLRLNLDGTLDTTFNIGTGFTSSSYYNVASVYEIKKQDDGKILVAGLFNRFNGNVDGLTNNIVRLNNDGSRDTNFLNPSHLDLNFIKTVSLFSDNKILASGGNYDNFYLSIPTTLGSDIFISIMNPDGTKNINFNNISKDFFDSKVLDIHESADNKIYACGDFHLYNGEVKKFFIRLNSDGSIDNSMNYGNGVGFSTTISQVDYVKNITTNLTNDKIFLSVGNDNGNRTYNSSTFKQIIKLNLDGSHDNSFSIVGAGFSGNINAILPLPNDKLLVGGVFNTYNSTNTCNNLGVLSNGSGILNHTTTFAVYSLIYQNDGKILVSGTGLKRYGVNSSGNLLNDNSLIVDPLITSINCDHIAVTSDDKIIMSGTFIVNGVSKEIIKLNNDGSLDLSFIYDDSNTNKVIKAFSLTSDNKIICSTQETTIAPNGYTTYNHQLLRLKENGEVDIDVAPLNLQSIVSGLKTLNDNGILLYNLDYGSNLRFNIINNVPVYGMAKLLGGNYYTIKGENKFDFESNGCSDSDLNLPNLNLQINNGTDTRTFIANSSGEYSFSVESGNYTLVPNIENSSYFNISPTSFTASFPSQTSPLTQDFCITPNGIHSDVEIVILPINSARPGFDANYKLVYKNKGNQTENGNFTLTFENSVLDFVSTSLPYNSSTSNSFTWNYSNLLPFEEREINIIFNLNSPIETPPVNNDDVLNFNILISTTNTDESVEDNTFNLNQTVVGSYDPNDKTCLQGTIVDASIIDNYAHYLIRFENTGSYKAEKIVIEDLIDVTKFNISTLTPLNSSHSFVTKIINNKVDFIFENINLDFLPNNNKGYLSFKIKTLPNLVVGDVFSNQVNILFDYNYAVTTNNYDTTIASLSNQNIEPLDDILIYPNPVNDYLSISSDFEIYKLEIYNLLGQVILVTLNPNASIDLTNLKPGNYILKLNTNKGIINKTFIKN